MKGKSLNAYTVDWITVTAKGKQRASALITQAVQTGLSADGQLPIQEPYHFQGFRGYRSEGLRYGTNHAGDGLVQMSGAHCAEHWLMVRDYWDQCSRIDLAVTVMLPDIDRNVALRAYNGLQEQKKTKTTYIQNNRGGATFYVGSRVSRRYGRIYDKGAEQGKQPGLIWRYEVEFKKPVSAMVLSALEAAGNKETLIGIEVREFFARYNVEVPHAPTSGHNAIEVGRNLTSDEKVLQWLVKQVAPAVKRLIEGGKGAEVLQALGVEPMDADFYFNHFKENDEWP